MKTLRVGAKGSRVTASRTFAYRAGVGFMAAIFPTLDRPSLFVASPGDMAILRRMATKIFEGVKRQGGCATLVQIYKYEDAELADTDSTLIQRVAVAPMPNDPRASWPFLAKGSARICTHSQTRACWKTYMPDLLLGIPANGKRYRLVHPWEEGAEETGGSH